MEKSTDRIDAPNKENQKRKVNPQIKRIRRLRLAIKIVVVLLICEIAVGALLLAGKSREAEKENTEKKDPPKSMIMSIAESTELVQAAKELKADYKILAAALKDQKVQESIDARRKVMQDVEATRAVMDKSLWKTAAMLPKVKDELATARELLQICEDADQALIGPYIDLMTAHPASELKAEGGIRVDVVNEYLDYLEEVLPQAESIFQRAKELDLSLVDKDGKVDSLIQKGEELLGYKDRLPLIRAILGNGEDRLYVFAAQNTSEMRSSGGFPGAIGTISIRDGLLSFSDFIQVREAFARETPSEANVTNLENDLFLGRMSVTWDADFCPNYERVASIWAMAYNQKNNTKVDGVISATPAIIQRLLSFLGDITLSDGTVINGENAARFLGHDIYYKYLADYDRNEFAQNNEIVDNLFAECAEKTFDLMISSFSISQLKDYFAFFEDSIVDRSMMIWLADESEQKMVRQAGWDAGLNRDPQKPEVGVFFSSAVDSKMTWYLNIATELSDPTVNADGSRSYDLTVTLSNVITDEEKELASQYILGWTDGITGLIYVFGPAGGSATDFETNIDRYMLTERYENLDVGFMVVDVHTYEPFVVRCKVTTAPGVETPIRIVTPPTMEAFR